MYTNRKTKCTPEATLHEINTEPALIYGRIAVRSSGKAMERDADIPSQARPAATSRFLVLPEKRTGFLR